MDTCKIIILYVFAHLINVRTHDNNCLEYIIKHAFNKLINKSWSKDDVVAPVLQHKLI